MDDLRLMRWEKDGFPPIDLNESMKDVRDLINEVKQLRSINKELLEAIETSTSLAISYANKLGISGDYIDDILKAKRLIVKAKL